MYINKLEEVKQKVLLYTGQGIENLANKMHNKPRLRFYLKLKIIF